MTDDFCKEFAKILEKYMAEMFLGMNILCYPLS